MTFPLVDDHMCYLCGKENKLGFKMEFEKTTDGTLTSSIIFRKEHQGYKNIAHGGLVAAVLDEMMVNLAWLEGIPVVTAELNIRLKKPTPVGEKIELEGRIEKKEGRAIYTSATAKNAKGELLASAAGVCLRLKKAFGIKLDRIIEKGYTRKMPYISLRVAGKLTREQKTVIAKEFAETLEKHAGKPKSSTYLVFDEVERENWAKGDQLLG